MELDRAQRLRKTRSRFTFRLASPRPCNQTMPSRRENESRLNETRSRRGEEKCSSLSLSLSLSLLLSRPSHLSAAPPRRLLSSTREIKIRSLPLTAARTTGSRYFQPDLDDRCFVHICTYVWRSLTPIAGPCHRTFYKINGYHLPCRERTLFRDDPSNTRRTWVTWLLFVAFLFLCFISRWNKTLKRMLFPLQWRVWLTWSL